MLLISVLELFDDGVALWKTFCCDNKGSCFREEKITGELALLFKWISSTNCCVLTGVKRVVVDFCFDGDIVERERESAVGEIITEEGFRRGVGDDEGNSNDDDNDDDCDRGEVLTVFFVMISSS